MKIEARCPRDSNIDTRSRAPSNHLVCDRRRQKTLTQPRSHTKNNPTQQSNQRMDEFLLQNSTDKRSLFGLAAGANDDDDNVDVSEDGSESDFDEDEDPDKIEVPGKWAASEWLCACERRWLRPCVLVYTHVFIFILQRSLSMESYSAREREIGRGRANTSTNDLRIYVVHVPRAFLLTVLFCIFALALLLPCACVRAYVCVCYDSFGALARIYLPAVSAQLHTSQHTSYLHLLPRHANNTPGGGRDLETASKFNKTPKTVTIVTTAATAFTATATATMSAPVPRKIPYVAVQQTLLQPRRVVIQPMQSSVLMPSTSQNARAGGIVGGMIASKPLTRLPTVIMPKAQFKVMPAAQPKALTAQSAASGPGKRFIAYVCDQFWAVGLRTCTGFGHL